MTLPENDAVISFRGNIPGSIHHSRRTDVYGASARALIFHRQTENADCSDDIIFRHSSFDIRNEQPACFWRDQISK